MYVPLVADSSVGFTFSRIVTFLSNWIRCWCIVGHVGGHVRPYLGFFVRQKSSEEFRTAQPKRGTTATKLFLNPINTATHESVLYSLFTLKV